mgnify:CR=1 FL=1
MSKTFSEPCRDLIKQHSHRPIGGDHATIGVLTRCRFDGFKSLHPQNRRLFEIHQLSQCRHSDATRLLKKLLLQGKPVDIESIIAWQYAWQENDIAPETALAQTLSQQRRKHIRWRISPLIRGEIFQLIGSFKIDHPRGFKSRLGLRRTELNDRTISVGSMNLSLPSLTTQLIGMGRFRSTAK